MLVLWLRVVVEVCVLVTTVMLLDVAVKVVELLDLLEEVDTLMLVVVVVVGLAIDLTLAHDSTFP